MEVVIVDGGEHIRDMLNAMAAFSGSNPFSTVLRVMVTAGMMIAAFQIIMKQNAQGMLHWLLTFICIIGVMLIPKTTVTVIDKSNPGLTGNVVSNVPVGIGYIASLSTTFGNKFTEEYETAVGVPTAISYSDKGMMWGQELLNSMTTLHMTSSTDQQNMNEFLRNCIFPDAAMKPTVLDELKTNEDLFAYFQGTASASRVTPVVDAAGTTTMKQCSLAIVDINTALEGATGTIANGVAFYGKKLYPDLSDTEAATAFEADLGTVHSEFLGVSRSGSDMLKQLFMINQMKSSMSHYANDAGSAAMMDYVNARADQQSRIAMSSLGQIGLRTLPQIYTIMLVCLIGIFPVVIMLSMIPGMGIGIIVNYIRGYFFVQSWPILLAIFNRIAQTESIEKAKAIAQTSDGGPVGLSLESIGLLANLPTEMGAMSASFVLLIPALAGIFTAGISVLGGQIESVLRPIHTSVEAAANEASTGNISLGNTSLNTSRFNEIGGNTIDTSGRVDFGKFTRLTKGGGEVGYMRDGSAFADATGAISRSIYSINSTRGLEESISQRRNQAENRMDESSQALQRSATQSMTQLLALQHAENNGVNIADVVGKDNEKSVRSAMQSASDHVRQYAEQTGKNFSDILSASSAITAEVGGKTPGLSPFHMSLIASGALSDNSSISENVNFLKSDDFKALVSEQDSLGIMQRANDSLSQSTTFGTRNEFTRGLNDSLSNNVQSSEALRQSVQEIQGLDRAQQSVRTQGSSIVADLSEWQFEELEKAYSPEIAQELTVATGKDEMGIFAQQAFAVAGDRAIQQYIDNMGGSLVDYSNFDSSTLPEMPQYYQPEQVASNFGRNEKAMQAQSQVLTNPTNSQAVALSNDLTSGRADISNSSIRTDEGTPISFAEEGNRFGLPFTDTYIGSVTRIVEEGDQTPNKKLDAQQYIGDNMLDTAGNYAKRAAEGAGDAIVSATGSGGKQSLPGTYMPIVY